MKKAETSVRFLWLGWEQKWEGFKTARIYSLREFCEQVLLILCLFKLGIHFLSYSVLFLSPPILCLYAVQVFLSTFIVFTCALAVADMCSLWWQVPLWQVFVTYGPSKPCTAPAWLSLLLFIPTLLLAGVVLLWPFPCRGPVKPLCPMLGWGFVCSFWAPVLLVGPPRSN